MPLTLKPYQAGDLDAVRTLFIELQTYEQRFLADRAAGETIFDQYWQDLEEDIQQHTGAIMLAELDGQVVGFIAYKIGKDILNVDRHLYISDLVVTESARGQGIAGQLMTNAEAFARQHDLKTVRVEVLAANPAKDFYAKQGYEVETLELLKRV